MTARRDPGSAALRSRLAAALAAVRGPGIAGVLSRGAAGNLLVSGAGAVVLVAVHMLLARMLGAAHFGHFVYATTLVNVLGLTSRLGMDTAQVRYVAAYRVQGDWGRLAGLLRFGDRLVLGVGSAVALSTAATVWMLRDRLAPDLAPTLLVAAALLPVTSLVYLRASALQGLRRVALAPIPDTLVRPLLLAALSGAAFWLLGGLSGAGAMTAQLVAAAAAAGVGTVLLRRNLPPEVGPARPESEPRPWLRTSLPLWLVAGMRFLLNQTDILLLGVLAGTTAAGIYGAASRLSRLVTFGLSAGNSISAPVISELHSQGAHRSLQRMVTLASWGTTAWSVLFAAVLGVGAPFLLGLFGDEFRAGAPVLIILAAGQVVNGATGPVGYLLNMTGHERANARILAWVVFLNLALSAPAILAFGPAGAAAVTAVLGATKNLWTWWMVKRRLGINSSVFSTWRSA